MMDRTSRGIALLLVSLGLTGACTTEDLLGPLDGKTFVLESVGGAPLPAVFDTMLVEDLEQAWTVFADTIWLVSNKWARHLVYQERYSDGQVIDRDLAFGGIVFRRDADLLLVFGEGGNCDCPAPEVVVADGSGLLMRETRFHGGTDLVFAPLN